MDIKIVSEKQVKMESKQELMEKEMTDARREITSLKREFIELVKEKKQNEEANTVKVDDKIEEMKDEIKDIRKTYSNMVQGNSASGADTVANSLNIPNRTIKVEVSEVMEREKRKNSLVIFGIEETNDEFATKEKLKNIINALGADENKIKYYGRVGRVGQGTKARIVRVTCEDAETKIFN